ncbi:MAG: SAM-dependent methyltransferase [Bacteroidetes bacterium]|nr:SAM-dependent methyltransferase [Bacteroidota bacterium]
MSTLYLIPVPISESAMHTLPPYLLEVLYQLDCFIVERAKTARHFLKAAQHPSPISSLEIVEMDEKDHREAEKCLKLAIASGRDVGIMSEAGCPGIADPGAHLVGLAHLAGIRVQALVGPSSLLLALMGSGMSGQKFAFHGYLSPKRIELGKDLRRLEQVSMQQDQTQIFIETPYRSQMVVEVALESLQADTWFGYAQDLTGAAEHVRSLPIKTWKKTPPEPLGKAPAVFLLFRGKQALT